MAAGVFLGPTFAALSGLGCALIGVSAWAWLNQVADALDSRFEPEQSVSARRLRAAGIVGLGLAAIGTLLALASFFLRAVVGPTGM